MRFRLSGVLLLLLAACQRPVLPPVAARQAPPPLAEGTVAPEIRLPTPQGKPLALSSLRGKYVVVIFWESGSAASRAESPNLQKIYRQFRSRGLEIYGVSLDTNRRSWRQAIRQDGLTWPQVLERRGRASGLVLAYGIPELPYSVLLDPAGNVLARNLRGRALGQKIAGYIPLD